MSNIDLMSVASGGSAMRIINDASLGTGVKFDPCTYPTSAAMPNVYYLPQMPQQVWPFLSEFDVQRIADAVVAKLKANQ